MKSRKSMLKTAEALIAIVLSLVFVVLIFSNTSKAPAEEIDVLHNLQPDSVFRNCAAVNDTACINSMINNSMPRGYRFYTSILGGPSAAPSNLPNNVYVESVIISGNLTNYNPTIISLYYWRS